MAPPGRLPAGPGRVPGRHRRRVVPGRGPSAIPPWAQAAVFGSVEGVASATPIRRERGGDAGGGGRRADRAGARGFRCHPLPRRSGVGPAGGRARPLGAERPAPELIELSGQPSRLRVAAEIEITSLVSQDFDEETGEVTLSDVPLSVLDGRPVYGASIVLRRGRAAPSVQRRRHCAQRRRARAAPARDSGSRFAGGQREGLPLHMTGPVSIVEVAQVAAGPSPTTAPSP